MSRDRQIARSGPFTTGQIARLSSVHINVVKKWIGAGLLDAYRLPAGHFRIPLVGYLSFLKSNGLPVPGELRTAVPRLLVIDDDATERALLCDHLGRSERFDVASATDGYDGLIKVGSFRPDIVFLDISMPRMDGFAMLEALTRNKVGSFPEVVIVTGNKDPEILARIDNFQIAGVVFKPYALAQIDAAIAQNLNR